MLNSIDNLSLKINHCLYIDKALGSARCQDIVFLSLAHGLVRFKQFLSIRRLFISVTGQGAWRARELGLDKLSHGLGEKREKMSAYRQSNEISLHPTMSNYVTA